MLVVVKNLIERQYFLKPAAEGQGNEMGNWMQGKGFGLGNKA